MATELDFYTTLFDTNEGMCFSDTPKGTRVRTYIIPAAFVSINPLHPYEDKNPTEDYHSAKIGRRADHNVSAYRNILIEMDKTPLEEQVQHMRTIELPFSTQVFSGNKSYHFIISLETPLQTRKEYNRLVARVYKAVGDDKVDQACKNPSRFTRAPGYIRTDTTKAQELVAVNGRISNERLEQWLVSRGVEPIVDSEWEDITFTRRAKDISSLAGSTRNFLSMGAESNWNVALFKASADLCRHGWSEDEAREMLLQITGTLDTTDEKTIHSAYMNERNQNG